MSLIYRRLVNPYIPFSRKQIPAEYNDHRDDLMMKAIAYSRLTVDDIKRIQSMNFKHTWRSLCHNVYIDHDVYMYIKNNIVDEDITQLNPFVVLIESQYSCDRERIEKMMFDRIKGPDDRFHRSGRRLPLPVRMDPRRVDIYFAHSYATLPELFTKCLDDGIDIGDSFDRMVNLYETRDERMFTRRLSDSLLNIVNRLTWYYHHRRRDFRDALKHYNAEGAISEWEIMQVRMMIAERSIGHYARKWLSLIRR